MRFTLSLDRKTSLEDRLVNWEYYYADKRGIPFFWFKSEHYSVRVNLGQLTYVRLMFDEIPIDEADSLTDCCESAPAIQVWMIGQQEPLEFEAYPDEAREEESDLEARFGQLNLMLADLEGPPDGFVSFLDIEDERVYLRVADIAMIAVRNCLLEPEMIGDSSESQNRRRQ